MADRCRYSAPYQDDEYQYRHVILSATQRLELRSMHASHKLLSEAEWRNKLGVTQSAGWEHYAISIRQSHMFYYFEES